MAHSAEEEVARDFICFAKPDAIIVVCDAVCLERNLNLVLQIIEISKNVVVCVNMMDEAKKRGIVIDIDGLSSLLGVPVVGVTARKKKSLNSLMSVVHDFLYGNKQATPIIVRYTSQVEQAISIVESALKGKYDGEINSRWLAIKLIDNDEKLAESIAQHLGYDIYEDRTVKEKLGKAKRLLNENGISSDTFRDKIVYNLVSTAESICAKTVKYKNRDYNGSDTKIDRIVTSKITGIPIMICLLAFVFWLTITGANYPSQLLSDGLFWIGQKLADLLVFLKAPDWLRGVLVDGLYRVLAWVVSVMLPPMAIFFPLFTLLEDSGYLPRVAFNLDKFFKKCNACGKQALTMCMGFGCNAAGIVGCRIIDSPRERLIAMITNNFVPCNGRFPTLIAILTMFFIGFAAGPFESVLSAILLTGVILIGIIMTFVISKLLSKTILKGVSSSFTLELPPYRKPQIGKVIVRSIFDRTLFVLGRAVAVAAPAGVVIWIMANVSIGNSTLLAWCSGFLDPFARLFGMDGVILLAFILGLPANEIVVPIIIMAYMASGSIMEMDSLNSLKQLLVDNGWTWITAVSTMLFSLMHWPCSTTCLTIKKETQSLKWTLISFVVPTIVGFAVCFVFANIAGIFYT